MLEIFDKMEILWEISIFQTEHLEMHKVWEIKNFKYGRNVLVIINMHAHTVI